MRHYIDASSGSEDFIQQFHEFREIRDRFVANLSRPEFLAVRYAAYELDLRPVEWVRTREDAEAFVAFMVDEGMQVAVCSAYIDGLPSTLISYWEYPDTGPIWPANVTPIEQVIHEGVYHMSIFDVTPLVGIGPVTVGMEHGEVREAMGGPFVAFQKGLPSDDPLTDAFLENAFQVFYDKSDRAEFIELSRGGPFEVRYKGVNVFETRAEELVAIVSQDADLDRTVSDPEFSFIFPQLGLSLWRQHAPEDASEDEEYEEDEEPGAYFDTVGIGRLGYFGQNDAVSDEQ